MDFFELIFVLIFIVFPILEAVRKRGQWKGQGPKAPPGPRPGGQAGRAGTGESAETMLPDDLWEVLTGQKRPDAPTGTSESAPAEPWEEAWDHPVEEPAWADGDLESYDDIGDREAVSSEYEGPEAYSLETPAPPPIERRVPSARERHTAFHALVDQAPSARRRAPSPLVKALGTTTGLRQAVLMKEILGPPKGME